MPQQPAQHLAQQPEPTAESLLAQPGLTPQAAPPQAPDFPTGPHPGYAPGWQYPAPAGYPQARPQLAPLDLPLLVRDIAAAVLLLLSLALPWWAPAAFSGTTDGSQSVPATIFTVLAVFACAVTYVLPMVFGTRFSSLALLGIKGVLVAPLVILGIIAIVQTLRSEEMAGPAVVVALVGAILTLQTADQERTAVGLWRNTTLALVMISALLAIVSFILSLGTVRGLGGLALLSVLTLALSMIVVGAVIAAVVTNRSFSAGIILVGATSLAVLIIGSFISTGSGFPPQMGSFDAPVIPQYMAVASLAAPALLRRTPALAGRDGWVPATSAFTLVTAALWGIGFLINVIVLLVLYGDGFSQGLGLYIWLLALQVIAALGFAITYRMLSTNLPQGRMVALIVAGLLAVTSVVTWAVADDVLPFTLHPFTILVFCLVLVGLVTIPPVMRATPMQTLGVPVGPGGQPPAGCPGQPYPGMQYPRQPGAVGSPAQTFPGARPPVGPRQGPPTGQYGPGPSHPISDPVPAQPRSGPQSVQPSPQDQAQWQLPGRHHPRQPDTGPPDSGPVPQRRNLQKEPHEDDEWHPRTER